jgi:hypothetical protein
VTFSDNVEGSVELNQNTLCVHRLSKVYNTEITEYINLEISGNNKGDDQKGIICMLPILLQLPPLLLPHNSFYSIDGKFELNQNNAKCMYSVKIAYLKIWVLSWNFQRILKGEHHLAKRHHVPTTANITVTATFTTTTIATTCKAKSIEMKISRSI